MKLSISLSAILVILPALVAGSSSSPLDVRALNGETYMPRRARNFGRHHQGQGAFGGNRFGQGGSNSKASTTAAAASNKSKSSTSVAAPATTTTAAAAVANNNGNQNKNKGSSKSSATTAAAADSTVCETPSTVTVTAGSEATVADAATTAAAASTTTTAAAGGNKNKNKGNKSSTAAAASTTAAAASTTDTSVAASSTTSAADAAASVADNGDPNTSLTLDPSLVQTGLENDGQDPPVDGQVPSLTSNNNFMNFCVGKTITNGQQITTGSCNPIPLGDIIPKANMPSCKFSNPKNFQTIKANQAFTIDMVLNNLQAGTFTNAQKTYYMAPQQLNGQQILIGHTHFVIQPMGNFDDPSILDPATFTFFKGVNTGQVNGVVSADVTAGVPAGNYRLASINTDSNHTPAIAAVAQHGWLDDMIYFTAA